MSHLDVVELRFETELPVNRTPRSLEARTPQSKVRPEREGDPDIPLQLKKKLYKMTSR